jgi:type 1 fimbria pilin
VLGPLLEAADLTVTPGTPVSGTGGTVGNGAIGAWTADAGAQLGTWSIEITVAASNAGKFKVVRPDGTVDGVGTVAVAYNGQLNGTLADGANDWVVGDVIPMVVTADISTVTYKKSASAATDGSQTPDLILAQDCDASSGDAEAIAYESGKFVGSALTLGTGHTVASIRAGLRAKGIFIDD